MKMTIGQLMAELGSGSNFNEARKLLRFHVGAVEQKRLTPIQERTLEFETVLKIVETFYGCSEKRLSTASYEELQEHLLAHANPPGPEKKKA